jgi:hypothetical protein
MQTFSQLPLTVVDDFRPLQNFICVPESGWVSRGLGGVWVGRVAAQKSAGDQLWSMYIACLAVGCRDKCAMRFMYEYHLLCCIELSSHWAIFRTFMCLPSLLGCHHGEKGGTCDGHPGDDRAGKEGKSIDGLGGKHE